MRRIFFLMVMMMFAVSIRSAFAAIDTKKLSYENIQKVQQLLEKLQPMIKEREAARTLATLTFDELYAPLDEEEKTFLKEFQDIDAASVGVSIPFRGIATGKESLVVIKDQRITMDGKPFIIPPQYLPVKTYEAYLDMMAAMRDDLGKRLYVESGYRSSAYQLYLFVYYLKNHDYSVEETAKWVALPGYSEHGAPEHQAIDFINEEGISGETNPKEFEDLEEYDWLLKNAGRFGFVLSYPRGQEGITFEPWHWRFEETMVKNQGSGMENEK